jgi:CRISPR-associated endonuclease Cas3-HD
LSASIDKNLEFLSHPVEEEKHNLIRHLIEVANDTQKLLSQTDFDIAKAGFYAGLLHDIGKLNPFYQELFLAKKKDIKEKEKELLLKYSPFHSPFSAWTGLKAYNKNIGVNYNTWLKIVSVIYGHHSRLYSRLPFKEDKGVDKKKYVTSKGALILNLRSFYQQIRDNNLTIFLNLNWDRCFRIIADPISFQDTIKLSTTDKRDLDNSLPLAIKEFLEINILYSALLQADKGSFKEWESPVFDISIHTSSLVKPESYLGDSRRDFQKEALENHDPTLNINVLNAPTGIGKTKVFLDFLEGYRQGRKLERVFYFSPLLALTEDFEKKITQTVMNIDDILVYNHLFSGTLLEKKDFKSEDKQNYNRQEWLFEYESFNKKFIITTTQRLLITLFSNKSSDKLKLLSFSYHRRNSDYPEINNSAPDSILTTAIKIYEIKNIACECYNTR